MIGPARGGTEENTVTETRVEDRDLIQGDDTLGLDQAEPSSEEAAPQDEAAAPTQRSAPAAAADRTDAAGAGAPDDGGLMDEADREPAEGRRDIG
jgi:hypothetical protein